MKKIKASSLKPGMRFSKTVYIDEDTILVQPEIPLKQRELDLLTKWGVDAVMTDGALVGDTAAEGAGRGSGAPSGPERRSARVYLSAVKGLEQAHEAIRTGGKVSHDSMDAIVNDIIAEVESDRESLIRYVLLGSESGGRLSSSSVNSAILATIIGRGMKLLSFKLVQLTTGALLHDVGMLKVDDAILKKKGSLSAEEIRQIRTHPIHGYSIVLKVLRYPEEIASIALLHQERWDGKGYPRRLKGEEIPLGARIVAVADAFEAMVNRRAYRDQVIGYKAIKGILSDNGRHFDPQVLKAFLACVGIHPVGSLVLLNDSSVGRVVANNVQAPLRPRVELIVDSSGQKLAEPVGVDLLAQKELFIARPVNPGEIEAGKSGRGPAGQEG
jgi:HD-GYP domain-containing protein (c-di-GMP phosphodiesterase class II)